MFKKSFWVQSLILAAFILLLCVSCSKKKATESAIQAPVLTTAAITGIMQTSAECGGTITYDGGSIVTARGVC